MTKRFNKNKIINCILVVIIILIMVILSLVLKTQIRKDKQTVKEMNEDAQVTELNNTIDTLNSEHEEYKKYITNSKLKIAKALTEQGVTTTGESTLETMATNISKVLQARTSDATATEEDILEGKTAYVNGKLINGSAKVSNESYNFIESFVGEANVSKTVNVPENNGYAMILIGYATLNSDPSVSFSGDCFFNVITQNYGGKINISGVFTVMSYCYFIEINKNGGELIIEGTPAIEGISPASGYSVLVYTI